MGVTAPDRGAVSSGSRQCEGLDYPGHLLLNWMSNGKRQRSTVLAAYLLVSITSVLSTPLYITFFHRFIWLPLFINGDARFPPIHHHWLALALASTPAFVFSSVPLIFSGEGGCRYQGSLLPVHYRRGFPQLANPLFDVRTILAFSYC